MGSFRGLEGVVERDLLANLASIVEPIDPKGLQKASKTRSKKEPGGGVKTVLPSRREPTFALPESLFKVS